MKHSISLSATLILFLLYLPEANSQWVSVQENAGNTLRDVFFTTPDTGFIVGGDLEGYGVMLTSTDGGNTWEEVVLDIEHDLRSVFFPSKNIGYTNGLKTTDGGSTWKPSPGNYYETDYFFINDTLGFYTDVQGCHGKTMDGGATWSYLSAPPSISLRQKQFEALPTSTSTCQTSRCTVSMASATAI